MVDARTIVGIIGNFISFALFLAPVPTLWRIIKKRDVEEFQPYAYIATCLNCMFWLLFGLPFVHPDSTLIITNNVVGLALELTYLSIFCWYDHKNKGRKVVGLGLLAEVIFVAVVAIITFQVFHSHRSRSMFVGIICDIFNIIMYGSPLTIWHKVIKTKSVEYMSFFLSLANFASGCIWTAYALIKLDKFILVSNGIGSILGLIQLIIYACYYKSTPTRSSDDDDDDDDDVVVKPTEVHLSGAVMA